MPFPTQSVKFRFLSLDLKDALPWKSKSIEILFPDLPNTANKLVAFEKPYRKLKLRAMCYFLNEMKKIISKKIKFFCIGYLFFKNTIVLAVNPAV